MTFVSAPPRNDLKTCKNPDGADCARGRNQSFAQILATEVKRFLKSTTNTRTTGQKKKKKHME